MFHLLNSPYRIWPIKLVHLYFKEAVPPTIVCERLVIIVKRVVVAMIFTMFGSFFIGYLLMLYLKWIMLRIFSSEE